MISDSLDKVLTSLLRASSTRVLSSSREELIRSRLRFSIRGLLLWKRELLLITICHLVFQGCTIHSLKKAKLMHKINVARCKLSRRCNACTTVCVIAQDFLAKTSQPFVTRTVSSQVSWQQVSRARTHNRDELQVRDHQISRSLIKMQRVNLPSSWTWRGSGTRGDAAGLQTWRQSSHKQVPSLRCAAAAVYSKSRGEQGERALRLRSVHKNLE